MLKTFFGFETYLFDEEEISDNNEYCENDEASFNKTGTDFPTIYEDLYLTSAESEEKLMAEVKLVNDTKEQYPSNSRTNQTQQTQRDAVQPVVKGKTTVQKPTFGERLKKTFLPGDIKDIREYAIKQVIIPGIQNGIIAMIEMAFFGQARRRSGGYYNNNQTNYSYVSTSQSRPAMSQRDRATHNFNNITFESYQDAEEVISTLLDILDRAGAVTVADFYEACRQPATWADADWGWRSFNKLESRAIRGGYIIDMTPPVFLR